MRPVWGDPATECPHGARLGTKCPVCNPHAPADPHDAAAPLVVTVLWLLVIVLFGRDAWQREMAFEDAQQRAHLERMDPSVRQQLRAIAAEQRR